MRLGPGQAAVDPPFQAVDLAVGQLPFRRHLPLAALLDRLDDQTLPGLAGHGGRPTVTALEHLGAPDQTQPAARLAPPVTLLAFLDQERTDLRLEELGCGGVVRTGGNPGECPDDRQQDDGEPTLRSCSMT